MISGSSIFLLALLALVGVAAVVLALTNRLPFRIGMRNVRRARGRTILLLLGLMVGTTIISGSLAITDTVAAVNIHFVLQNYGYADEGIYNQTAVGGYQYFPAGVFANLSGALSGNSAIRGLTAEIVAGTQAFDHRNGIPETNLDLVGADPAASSALGSFTTDGGSSLAGPSPGQLLLDDQAATQLSAQVGDPITLYSPGGTALSLTVGAIVRDDSRGGVFFLFLGQAGNVFVSLSDAQRLLSVGPAINFIAVTNPGDLLGGTDGTAAAMVALNASLASIHAPAGLEAHDLLSAGVSQARQSGQQTGTFFLVFGLFSIIAGAILVVGIFVMLAEERKGEMGTIRAIGLRRRDLLLAYLFEGFAYSTGSALVGTILGVGVGYAMTYAFSVFLSTGQIASSAILDSFTISTDSLITAYAVGFLLTLVTVAFATARVSRLNIVRAIRSIPEPPPQLRTYTRLAYLGIPLVLFGALVLAATGRGTSDISLPNIGLALLIAGGALIAARFLKNRTVFSVAGLVLIAWAGYNPIQSFVLGDQHTGSIFVVFTLGMELIFGAILLYVFNAKPLVDALVRVASGRPRRAAVVQTGLAYPGRRPVRPALTLTIFTLVVFVVVVVAGFGASMEAHVLQSVSAQTGGYSFFTQSSTPIPDLAGQVHNNSTLRGDLSAVVPVVGGGAFLNWSGLPAQDQPFAYPIYAVPSGLPYAAPFYEANEFTFASTLNGSSASSTWADLGSVPGTAVLDGSFTGGGFGAPHPTLAVGSTLSVADPLAGTVTSVRLIGILTGSLLPGLWLNPTTAGQLGFHDVIDSFMTVAPGASAVSAAQHVKTAFFAQGMVVYDFAQILGTSLSAFQAILSLLEVFAALGLGVGIAAMGIVALRAVSERRREIGMVRAAGFTQRDVFKSFLLEYSFISVLGIVIGTVLALVLDYEATVTSGGTLTYTVPWATIVLIGLVAYAMTVLAVFGPAIRAARLPPSEAVRYVE